jgi:hypothetical protein
MDLCVVAVDVGRVGDDYVSHPHQTLYFSKKTTPGYPVGEAVRRSMSLPFVFYPRKIDEGDGSNPPDVTAPGRFGGGRVPREDVRMVVNYRRHHDAVLLDGGFRVNLPVAVFRDPSSVYMENEFTNGEPVKHVVSFNLNDLKNAPERPAAVPPPQLPSPLSHLVKIVSEALPEPAEPVELSDGLKRLVLSGGQTLDLMTGAGREDEQRDLLALVPKSLLVDIGTRDPNADQRDQRFSGLDFGAHKVTKKWMCRSGWAAGAATLEKLAAGSGLAVGVGATVDPYGHALVIDQVSRPAYLPDLERPASFAPNPRYSRDRDFRATPERTNGRPFPLGAGEGSQYVGVGAFWLRTRDRDLENRDETFLTFRVNRACRILLLTDPQAVLPGFVRNDPEWDEEDRPVGTTDMRVGFLRVVFRDFPAGTVQLGGPRSNGGDGNRCQYAILVQAR